jgi:hypothetical protein
LQTFYIKNSGGIVPAPCFFTIRPLLPVVKKQGIEQELCQCDLSHLNVNPRLIQKNSCFTEFFSGQIYSGVETRIVIFFTGVQGQFSC